MKRRLSVLIHNLLSALNFAILVFSEGITLVSTVKASNSSILNNNVLVVLVHVYNLLSHFFLVEVKFSYIMNL